MSFTDLGSVATDSTSISWSFRSLLQRDELGMTPLHVLCLNPNATPAMFKMIANACPQAATIQAEMITQVDHDDGGRIVEMVTPTKLWLKVKGISYNDNTDFSDEGRRISLSRALRKNIQWNELLGMIYIQQSLSECVEQHEDTKLYPFMQVATMDGMDNLETLYQLALLDTRMIYGRRNSN